MRCHQTWKKNIYTKIVFWNGLFKQWLATVNSKNNKINKEVKRNSWTTWLRDQALKTCLSCLAFLAEAAQVTRSSKMRGQVQVWQILVSLSLGLPECIWTILLVWTSTSQALLAGKAPSNSFTLSVVPCKSVWSFPQLPSGQGIWESWDSFRQDSQVILQGHCQLADLCNHPLGTWEYLLLFKDFTSNTNVFCLKQYICLLPHGTEIAVMLQSS